jgi:tetratricopeptide (TPR) repeat protein
MDKIDEYIANGNHSKAIELLKKEIVILRNNKLILGLNTFKNVKNICFLIIKVGDLYCATGEWNNGLAFYSDALSIVSSFLNVLHHNYEVIFLSVQIQYKIASSQSEIGMNQEALKNFNDALTNLEGITLPISSLDLYDLQYEKAMIYNGRSGCHFKSKNIGAAIEDSFLAYSILDETLADLGDSVTFLQKNSLARICVNYAAMLSSTNDHNLAITFYNKAISIWIQLKQSMGLNFPEAFSYNFALALMQMGDLLFSEGSIDEALEKLNFSLNLWKDLGNKTLNNTPCRLTLRISKCLWWIANCYKSKHDDLSFLSFTKKSLGSYNELINSNTSCREKAMFEFAVLNSQLGLFYQKTNNQILSLSHRIDAINIFESLIYKNKSDPVILKYLSVEYVNVANEYVSHGSFKKAEPYYLKSINGFEKLLNGYDFIDIDLLTYLIRVNSNLGLLYMELNDHRNSLLHFKDAAILIKNSLSQKILQAPEFVTRFEIINTYLINNNITI